MGRQEIFWARFKEVAVELFSEFWFKKMGFKIKRFEYFHTKFELDPNRTKSKQKLFDEFSNLKFWNLV
jgi:hypothetical protein